MVKTIMRRAASGACVCAAIACGSDESREPGSTATTPSNTVLGEQSSPAGDMLEPEPGSRPVSETGICNNLLNANDIPFATAVFAVSDACPSQRRGAEPLSSSTVADVRRESPGKYCVTGTLASGFAIFIVSFDEINDMPAPPFHGPLDAAALGVSQFRFTLESPPSTGLQVALSNVVRDDCPFSSDECIQSGFYVLNEAGVPVTITEAGTYVQQAADYRPGPEVPPSLRPDMTRLSGLTFELNSGAFNLCVSDIQLLDDAGNPISPPE